MYILTVSEGLKAYATLVPPYVNTSDPFTWEIIEEKSQGNEFQAEILTLDFSSTFSSKFHFVHPKKNINDFVSCNWPLILGDSNENGVTH